MIGYTGWVYAKVRAVDDHVPLIGISMNDEIGWFGQQVVTFELKRRISNNEFDGVQVDCSSIARVLKNHTTP